jgi:hypothetical protein
VRVTGSLRHRHPQRGQAATETIIMMMFLLLMIFGLVHLCMLMTVKYMVNYSAFSAARTAMVDPGFVSTTLAGQGGGMSYMNGWWKGTYIGLNIPYIQGPINKTIRGKNRQGYSATYAVPFGLPIFNTVQPCGVTNAQPCGVRLIGFSPYAKQPSVPDEGDNSGK